MSGRSWSDGLSFSLVAFEKSSLLFISFDYSSPIELYDLLDAVFALNPQFLNPAGSPKDRVALQSEYHLNSLSPNSIRDE